MKKILDTKIVMEIKGDLTNKPFNTKDYFNTNFWFGFDV